MKERILGLVILSILLLLLDKYIYSAIISVRPKWKRLRFTYIWWGFSIFLVLGTLSSIFFDLPFLLRMFILILFFLTAVAKIFFFPFLIIDDLRRGTVWMKRKLFARNPPITENNVIPRSEFLLKAATLAASIPFASLAYGTIHGVYDYQVKRRTLYLPNLPKVFDGIKLGQLSDVHSGSFYNRKAVMGGVNLLLNEKPDFIFFTGDLVNNLASEMRDYQDIFSKVKAPLGVFSTLGNHDYGEYYYGKDPSIAKAKNLADVKVTHKNMGWDLLMNENRRLRVNGEEIAIIGVENWGAGRFPKYGRMDLAMPGTEDAPVKLLLSHDPSHWRAQVLPLYPQIDVMFSGHTHGMQFGLLTDKVKWSPVQYIYKEWADLYQEKHQQLYVNVGFGFLGYPGRVGVLPEITIFELKRGIS